MKLRRGREPLERIGSLQAQGAPQLVPDVDAHAVRQPERISELYE